MLGPLPKLRAERFARPCNGGLHALGNVGLTIKMDVFPQETVFRDIPYAVLASQQSQHN